MCASAGLSLGLGEMNCAEAPHGDWKTRRGGQMSSGPPADPAGKERIAVTKSVPKSWAQIANYPGRRNCCTSRVAR